MEREGDVERHGTRRDDDQRQSALSYAQLVFVCVLSNC